MVILIILFLAFIFLFIQLFFVGLEQIGWYYVGSHLEIDTGLVVEIEYILLRDLLECNMVVLLIFAINILDNYSSGL